MFAADHGRSIGSLTSAARPAIAAQALAALDMPTLSWKTSP